MRIGAPGSNKEAQQPSSEQLVCSRKSVCVLHRGSSTPVATCRRLGRREPLRPGVGAGGRHPLEEANLGAMVSVPLRAPASPLRGVATRRRGAEPTRSNSVSSRYIATTRAHDKCGVPVVVVALAVIKLVQALGDGPVLQRHLSPLSHMWWRSCPAVAGIRLGCGQSRERRLRGVWPRGLDRRVLGSGCGAARQ